MTAEKLTDEAEKCTNLKLEEVAYSTNIKKPNLELQYNLQKNNNMHI